MYGEKIVLNTVYDVYMYGHAKYMHHVGRQPTYITFVAFYLYFEYVDILF